MDDKTPTTRKRFLQRAGLALAGAFAIPASSKAASSNSKHAQTKESKADPFKRIRPAKGTVQRIA